MATDNLDSLLKSNPQPPQTGFIVDDTEAISSSGEAGDFANREFVHRVGPSSYPAMMSARIASASTVPDLFTTHPLLRDFLVTESSQIQDETVDECLPFLSGLQQGITFNEHGVPHLDRRRHIQFLHKGLRNLPSQFVAADASRPWMFYWALAGLSAMGEDVSEYRERIISTLRPIQNPTGGFGGGNGQMSHLASTYAALLSLAIVGGKEAFNLVDRKSMWEWLSVLKQPDGGFQMSVGGEEDIRGAYCAAVIITLLDLPLELSRESPAWTSNGATLLTNLPEWVAKCQSFEGGFSGRPDAEAHGAYAFCALACLCVLGDPHIIIPKYIDVPRLISWLSSRQYAPEGGFSGRTNKLVDGCYSHWVGGCWPLLEASLDGPFQGHSGKEGSAEAISNTSVGSLFSREGLIRYILCCCQDFGKRGGLRDKPSHMSDSYHTCYVLAGLSSAQHKWHFNASTDNEPDSTLTSAYQWTAEPVLDDSQIYDEQDRVEMLHPVFVICQGRAEEMRAYFASQGGL
ncbi:hypothetical protein BP6252_01009 [Coleophoma cylindrospora]|uniref:Protein farnesyltransferase subunit beta n=1 Tax=Coleophoma cylindrospora TaxID=1849047 RepID=A0A3D8SRQ5_9HELO|nr:hypothetical protein BP6252_01009 [Coleophoma cylindrospora]